MSIFKLKDGKSTQTFEGFSVLKKGSELVAVVYDTGEYEWWSLDNTTTAIEEL